VHRVAVGSSAGATAGNPIELVTGGEERTLSARHVIIATGSRVKGLPFLRPDGDRLWSSDQAVYPASIPSSLAVVGAGAVGMEFADVYASFGVRVTIIEAAPRVLPLEEPEASAVVEKVFRRRGIDVLTGAQLERAETGPDGVRLTVAVGDGAARTIETERVLVAVGRSPVIEGLGLEEAGVALERGFIVTDDRLRTNMPGLYAIGDVTRPPLLAHKAWAEAAAVIGGIAQDPYVAVDYSNIPSVTYCHPEVASVGLTEAAALAQGFKVTIGRFPWSANGRARAIGETDGFIKLVRNADYGELLGAHIVGPHASELIGTLVVGRLLETTVEELELAVLPHPTLSDSIPEAALAAVGRAIHI
jgi:dihydrolipoamide dehydrogenase